jgi:hypothetical protein
VDGHEAGGERTAPVAGVEVDRTVPVRRPGAPVLVVSAAVTRPAAGPLPLATPVIQVPAGPVPLLRHPPSPAPVAPGGWGDRAARLAERIHPVQVVCWQVAVLAIVLAVREPWPGPAAGVAGATVLLGLTGVRVRGRWAYELAGLALRFRLRPRRHVLPRDAGTAPALIGLLLPDSAVRTMATGQGPALAISHPLGLTAMIRPRVPAADPAGSFADPAALVPVTEQPQEFGVRAVFHSGAPDAVPGVWLAVHAARTVDTALDEELTLVLHNGLRRVRQALERAGVPTEPLPEGAAFAAITALAHLTGGRVEVREDWRFVRTAAVSQACFALAGWHRLAAGDARRLLPLLLGRTGRTAATLAVTAWTLPSHRTRTRALLRLAATTDVAVDRAAEAVAGLLAPAGVGMVRLDGGHLPGLADSLPIGGISR